MEELNRELADILEIDNISNDEILQENELWDSLSRISLQAFIDSEYDISLEDSDFEKIKSVKDIKDIIKSKLQK